MNGIKQDFTGLNCESQICMKYNEVPKQNFIIVDFKS